MKFNKWTLALAAAGVLSLGSVVQAEEAQHQVLTALSSTTLSGYVDTSANWRIGSEHGRIPGRVFDGGDKQDGFNLNAIKISLEKPLDEGQWSAGYKADLIFGPDASFYRGGVNGLYNDSITDQLAIQNAYVNARIPVGNGIDVKMGIFGTPIGYETFDSGNNPNYSRSYGFALEPTNHTGLLASYHIVENVTISGGIANTWTGPTDGRAYRHTPTGVPDSDFSQSEKTYMGMISVTMPDSMGFMSGSTLYGGVIDGLGGNTQDTTSYYAGLTLNTPVKGLAAGAAFDYRTDAASPGGSNWAYALAGYLTFQASEKIKIAARGDWTQGSNGTYYAAPTGDQNEMFATTLTLDYALWSNLITRLEGRWDHNLTGDEIYDNETDVFTVALNAIFKF